ncbi:ABC transporter permease [Caballeronia sp. LP006]|uniref:ABC transporter permease n=1 Tax=Caballeronia sp. LP006 TaxID=3038552 RepID=UPI002858AC87|nr:ABC transporter permease [Caballeronia sp. LP006]MDR5826927.1 ABC transporter permease [Caballeronia sp. LP006]
MSHPTLAVEGQAAPAPRRAAGLRWRRLVVPVALLSAWQLASSTGFVNERRFSSPAQIATTLWELAAIGELGTHLLASLARAGSGLAIGLTLGVALALVSGLSRRGEDSVDALLQMTRTLPHLALVPLFILWFGIGETPKIALVALGCLIPVYLNLFAGIRSVDAKIVEMASTLGLTRAEQIRHIVLPGALPSFLVGLRYSLSIAWLSLVVGEQINASSGIGYLAITAQNYMRTDIIMACLLIYALLGLVTDALVRGAEKRLLAWRPSTIKD